MTEAGDPREPVVVRAEGLVLREWVRDDLAAMVALFDEAEVDRWTPIVSPFDEPAAAAYLERARSRQANGTVQLAITEDGSQPLGEVLLFPTDIEGVCELGYVVGAPFRGRRLALRALRALMPLAVARGYRQARLTIAADNLASNRVAEEAGFRPTGDPLAREERKGYVLDLASWTRELGSS